MVNSANHSLREPEKPIEKPKGKVPKQHREKLARATGKLVEQIERSNPKEALAVLLRSFDDKTKTTIKTHRKRFIMFKSEQPKGNHTWGAYWHEYWEVARAALEHLAQDKRGEEKQKYINRELRQFMRIGQGEEIPFLAGSDTDLLEEWAKQVVTRVSEDSEIERLWQTLWRMPFTPCDIEQSIRWLSQSTEQGSETANGSTMGTPIAFRPLTAREVANRDRDGWYSNGPPDRLRYFSFGVSIPSGWFIPRVSLGWVYFRDKFRLFVLPEQFRGYERDLQGPDDEIHWDAVPDFLPWLGSVGGSEGCLPLPEYSDELGYGWYESEFYAVSEIMLSIGPDETGTPALKIHKDPSTEAIPVAFVETFDDDEAEEVDLVERILRSSNEVGFDDFIDDFRFWPRKADARECEEALAKLGAANAKLGYKNGLFNIYEDNWPADDIPAWAEDVAAPLVGGQDSARDGLLFAGGSEYRFYPNFFFDEEHTDAAPAGSLAAAIIANSHASPPEAQIANRLLEQAQKIANAGLAYAHEVRERHLKAIRQI